MIVEKQERESDLIQATSVPWRMSGNQQVGVRVVVEIGLPDGREPDSSKDGQNRLPLLAIIVATLKEDATAARNYLRAPKPDRRAGIARCTKMTDLIEVPEPRKSSP